MVGGVAGGHDWKNMWRNVVTKKFLIGFDANEENVGSFYSGSNNERLNKACNF